MPLLDALRIERAVLAGHSGSCLSTRRVAIDHAEHVAGLVLEASPTTLVRNERFRRSSTPSCRTCAIRSTSTSPLLVDTSSEAVEPTLLDELTRDLLKVPAHVWREMFAGLLNYDDTRSSNASLPPPC